MIGGFAVAKMTRSSIQLCGYLATTSPQLQYFSKFGSYCAPTSGKVTNMSKGWTFDRHRKI